MRSSRNRDIAFYDALASLIDWKMRSSRNRGLNSSARAVSLIDWKMRSSRNLADVVNADTSEFNRLENAL